MATPATAQMTATAVLLALYMVLQVLYMVPQVLYMNRYRPRQAATSVCQLLTMTFSMIEAVATLVSEPG